MDRMEMREAIALELCRYLDDLDDLDDEEMEEEYRRVVLGDDEDEDD